MQVPPPPHSQASSESLFASQGGLLDEVPAALFLVDGATKQIREANREAERLLGYAAGSLTGVQLAAVVGTRDEARHLLECKSSEAPEMLTRVVKADGSNIPAMARVRCKSRHEIILFVRAINAEDDPSPTQRAVARIFETSPVSMVTFDHDLRISFVNEFFRKLYGYEDTEIVGRPIWHLSAESDPEKRYRHVVSKVGPSRPWRGEDKRRKRNDTVFWASSSINEVRDPQGQFLCYVDASRDNTERVRQVELLEDRTIRDPLTGIFNRRYFNQRIEREWARAIRKRRPIGLLLIDIDYFKKFNDRYGHLEGDTCLTRVAKALGDSARRATDVVSRYGGEEFTVILPDARNDGSLAAAQRMLEGVRALGIAHEGSDVAPVVTVSIGMAIDIPDEGSSWKGLLQSADDALYRAKMLGRDRVEIAKKPNSQKIESL